jgi:hypothetical protein
MVDDKYIVFIRYNLYKGSSDQMKTDKPLFPNLPEKVKFKTVYYDIYRIKVCGDEIIVDEIENKFDTFESAYDYIERELDALPSFNAKLIAGAFPEYDGNMSGMLVKKETRRLFISRGDRSLWDLARQYRYFKKVAKVYLKNKKDFYSSYQFLTYHPVFWALRGDLSRSKMLFWETDDGLDKMWHTVYKDADNKIFHLLEHGPYIDNEEKVEGKKQLVPARIPSHDIRLDVVGKTYEEAIIKLAKRVHKFYKLNGEERLNHSV